jgi:5-(carboxyamino)imidazole ribonucleotide synthase
MQQQYFVYILLCNDYSYYVGLTDDLLREFEEHRQGTNFNVYTFNRRPVELKYYETIPFLNDAKQRALQLKGWSRAKKKALIEQNFHKLQLLSQCQNMSHSKYKEFDSAHSENASRLRSGPPKVGILGGGQLGRMLLQAAANYVVETYVLENDEHCPAAHLCHHFVKGDINDFETVYHFGKGLDALTIEIESVNTEALEKLEAEGVKIYPAPAAIKIIKNKITQKEFYKQNKIPTPDFRITNSINDLKNHFDFIPAVHKIGMGGYDGKGVRILPTEKDFDKGFNAPSVLEKMINIKKEIALIVAINNKGETAVFPPAEMVFDPLLNLLDYQVSPAQISNEIMWKAEAIAIKLVKAFQSPGIFAIEMFVDKNNELCVNETAPRVHNSGHHTIEGNYCSQYDMLWRIILDYPLGNTDPILSASIVNLIGTEGYSGEAKYEGLTEVLKMENVFVHLYGKTQTRPGRKMGHVTILSKEYHELTYKAHKIKNTIKVIS